MKRPIELVTGILEEAHEPASDRVRGRHGSHEVEIRFVDRGAGSSRDPYTEVWFLGAARRVDLHLHVIPQTHADVAEVAQGRGTDVILGDRAFDEAFFVEAAPRDVIVRLFDASLRERMTRLRPLGVHTRPEGLLVEKPTWDNEAALGALVALGAHLVDAIPAAFTAADREVQSREGYRTTVSAEALGAERRDEVAIVAAKQRERDEHRARMGCILLGLLLLAISTVSSLVVVFCGDGHVSSTDSYE
jgi:hypothetical protein